MSRVNLLPSELREQQAVRRQTALVGVAGAAVLVLLGVFYFFQTVQLSSARSDVAQQQVTNAALQQQITQLQPYANLQQELAAKKQLKDTLFQDEVSWSGVLLDVSRVIPDTAYLSNLSGTLNVQTGTTVGATGPATTASGLIGTMTFSGVADQTDTIASWLTHLEDVKGWVNPWVNSAQEQGANSGIYQFDTGVDLTSDAATVRGRGGAQ